MDTKEISLSLQWDNEMQRWGAWNYADENSCTGEIIGTGATKAQALRDAANTIEGWTE